MKNFSLASLQKCFDQKQGFIVCENRHDPGVKFYGEGKSGIYFVISGECKFLVDDDEITIKAQSFAGIRAGSFNFEVVGREEVRYVMVFFP